MKKEDLSMEEWKEIGNKMKGIEELNFELLKLLKKLYKTKYYSKWVKINKSLGGLKSHLDNMVSFQFKDLPDNEVFSIFYGENNK